MLVFIDHPEQAAEHASQMAAASKGRPLYLALGDHVAARLETDGFDRFEPGPIDREDQDRFVRDYVALVDALGGANADDTRWWATTISSKSRIFSPLITPLVALFLVMKGVEESRASGRALLVLGAPRSLRSSVADMKIGMTVVGAEQPFWGRVKARCAARWRNVKGLFAGLRVVVRRQREVRRFFAADAWDHLRARPAYLVKSFTYPSSFGDDGSYDDPFFKELPSFVKEKLGDDWVVPTMTMCFEDGESQYARIKQLHGKDVLPVEAVLRWRDIALGFVEVLCAQLGTFRCPSRLEFCGWDVAGLVRDCLLSGGGEIAFGQYVYYAIGRNVAEVLDLRACALTMEGNPWEKMFVAGIRQLAPRTCCIGVQHAVVMKGAAGMFQGAVEPSRSCSPDWIATTGDEPADLIRRYGQFPADRVVAACALRYGYLFESDFPARDFQPGAMKVLVVLEGLTGADDLVRYVLRESGACSGVEFSIRAHPLRPLDDIVAGLGESLEDYDNVRCSEGGSVLDDVERCDVVMYWGTTVSLEALKMKRPLVHFDRGDIPSCDPLFAFDEFKWIVGGNDSLAAALEDVERVLSSPEDRDRRSAAGVAYIERYFHAVNEGRLRMFVDAVSTESPGAHEGNREAGA